MSLSSVLPSLPGVYTQKSSTKQKLVFTHCMIVRLETIYIMFTFQNKGVKPI